MVLRFMVPHWARPGARAPAVGGHHPPPRGTEGTPCAAPVQARAHLLSVGIIRPAPDVTAIDVNAFQSSPMWY